MSDQAGRLVVAKVGGSLFDWPPFPDRLARFLSERAGRGERLVLIAGGGGAADWVRLLDRVHRLGDAAAHALAVRSLDLTAHGLAALVPGLTVVGAAEEVAPAWRSGLVPVLSPRLILDADDRDARSPLPRSWDCTTDAIAARIASRLGAEELVLLKSVGVPPGTTRAQASERGAVDRIFPSAARGIGSVTLLNLRDGQAVSLAPD